MKFQYISDIHLEFYKTINTFKLIPLCDNLFLLGDIGYASSKIYHEFISYCSKNWKNVIVIMGNHEYYCTTKYISMNDIEDESLKFPENVYFLQNNCIFIDKNDHTVSYVHKCNSIKIIGSTLWSNISLEASIYMNDYYNIYNNGKNITPEFTRNLFFKNKDYILSELEKDIDTQTILLTHHGVSDICNGPYQGGNLETAFVTDFTDELKKFKQLIVCINGHTHVSINDHIPDTSIKLLANCYGYKGESKNVVKYNQNAILEIL